MNQRRYLRYAPLVVIFVTNGVLANTSSKKTFLSPLPRGLEHAYVNNQTTTLNTHLQVTGFYQDSVNHHDTGRYFGIGNGNNSFTVGDAGAIASGAADILNGLLIHNVLGGPLAGTVSFNPRQQIGGLHVHYFQNISWPLCGLFLKAHMPLVSVKNTVALQVINGIPSGTIPDFTLQDFFAGRVEQSDPGSDDLQIRLNKAKINGSRHTFGVADIDLALGYKYIHTDASHLFFTIGLTIPTGNRVHGEFLFQPVCGNGQHVGLGAGLDAGTQLWCNHHASLQILVAAEYRYLFAKTEQRTVGVKNLPLGYYFLAGKIGQVDEPLFPAANILTTGVRVTPANQLNTLVALSFTHGRITCDIGHTIFFKEREHVRLKRWDDNVFVIASPDYSTSGPLDPGTGGALQSLNTQDLDANAAATPTRFASKFFAGLYYATPINKQHPISVGTGGSYECGSSNAVLQNYELWLKVIVSC